MEPLTQPSSAINAEIAADASLMHPRKEKKSDRTTALVDAAVRIGAEKPSGDDIAFMHAILCQIGLPRSRVAGERFERSSGSASLVVHGGEIWNGQVMVKQPIPYGSIPRLVLAHLTRYAVRHKTREIPFGESANDAMRQLGIDKSGRSYVMFQRQVRALAACSITLGFNADGRAITFDGRPVQKFEAWLSAGSKQRTPWPSRIVLSRDFHQTLMERAVPYDLRALLELRGSALAMDVYLWLVARLVRVRRKSTAVYWSQLKEQFGHEYRDIRNFKRKFLIALRDALLLYPMAKVEEVPGGLRLYSSQPAVQPRFRFDGGKTCE